MLKFTESFAPLV